MYGYATDETEECMPLSLVLAHKLNKRLVECHEQKKLEWIRPDSKSQVMLEPVCVQSTPHIIHSIHIGNR